MWLCVARNKVSLGGTQPRDPRLLESAPLSLTSPTRTLSVKELGLHKQAEHLQAKGVLLFFYLFLETFTF